MNYLVQLIFFAYAGIQSYLVITKKITKLELDTICRLSLVRCPYSNLDKD